MRLMEGEHVGPFNLGNPGEFTMLELAEVSDLFLFLSHIIHVPNEHRFDWIPETWGWIPNIGSNITWSDQSAFRVPDTFVPCRWSKKPLTRMRGLSSGPTQRTTHTRGSPISQGRRNCLVGSPRCRSARVFLSWSRTLGSVSSGTTRKVAQPLDHHRPHLRFSWDSIDEWTRGRHLEGGLSGRGQSSVASLPSCEQ